MLTSWALGPLLFLVELLDFSHISAYIFGVITFLISVVIFRRNYILGVITFSA